MHYSKENTRVGFSLLKRDSGTRVFLWLMRNFYKHLFYFEGYLQTATFKNLSVAAILIFRRYFESSSLSVFCRIGILKTAKFLGKHICRSLFSVQLQTFSLKIYQIKECMMDIFQWIWQNIYFKNTIFTGLLWYDLTRLLLIFRKLDIQTFNTKQIFSQMFFIGPL